MHEHTIINKVLEKSCPKMHKRRLNAVSECVLSICRGADLATTSIGRKIDNNALPQSNIAKVDTLLDNPKFHKDGLSIYSYIAQYISSSSFLVLLVDWTELPEMDACILRAATCMHGRSLTVYQELHPMKKLNNKEVERNFLITLRSFFPEDSKVIIVTDAGFYYEWFNQVERLGWAWVGRIRNKTQYFDKTTKKWCSIKELHAKAKTKAQTVYTTELFKTHKLNAYICFINESSKGRVNKTLKGEKRKSKKERYFAHSQREPWVIAASVSLNDKTPKQIINIYKKRMQIEEGFRDVKSHRYGLGFCISLSYLLRKINGLIILSAITMFVLMLVGIWAAQNFLHHKFQTHSSKSGRKLSIPYLARLIFAAKHKIPIKKILHIFSNFDKWDLNLCV